MNWTMPYPWRSRSDSVRRINMSSEPGNESFFCALRPIPRILSLPRRDYASQVQIGEPSRRKTISGCSRAPETTVANGEDVDAAMVAKIRSEETPEIDPFEAMRVIEQLAQGDVDDVVPEGDSFRITLRVRGATTIHLLKMPSQK